MAYFEVIMGSSGSGVVLSVTCASEFAGETITCAKTGTTLTKTCPSVSPYAVEFNIPESGTWTVSATVNGVTYSSDPVVIDLAPATVLNYGFNWQTWVDTASLLDSTDYSTLADLLADETAIRELCLEHATVDYMCGLGNVNATLETVINNDIFAKWVNLSDYALDNMYANAAIKTAMDTADKYGYGEWCLMPQVPTMTSNTAPYGVASSRDYYTGQPYLAFDGNDSTLTNSQNDYSAASGWWLRYQFVSPVAIKKVRILFRELAHASRITLGHIRASADGTNFINIDGGILQNLAIDNIITLTGNTAYKYWEVYIDTASDRIVIETLQFYAWQSKGNVPIMTSNTAPYGTASASSSASGYNPYNAFDGVSANTWRPTAGATNNYVGYSFVNPVCLTKFKAVLAYSNVTGSARTDKPTFKIQGSNNGTNWTDLTSFQVDMSSAASTNKDFTVDENVANTDYYLQYRLFDATAMFVSSTYAISVKELQFYGRELSVSVPIMTSNTAPYGEASGSSLFNNGSDSRFNYFHAFNGNTSNGWLPNDATPNEYVYCDFKSPVCIRKALINLSRQISPTDISLFIDVSNDLTNWTTIATSTSVNGIQYFDCTNNGGYRYARLCSSDNFSQTSNGYWNTVQLQFYGLNYSEKEFEAGATKKWLYDHGVEVEPIIAYVVSGASNIAEKQSDCLFMKGATGSSIYGFLTTSKVDITNFTLQRCKLTSPIGTETRIAFMDIVNNITDSHASAVASVSLSNANSPNNHSLDVSSCNNSYYPTIRETNGNSNSYCGIAEWWLE